MDAEMKRSSKLPAFGSWDCNDDDLPFTQCFETAARPTSGGLLRYSYSGDRDLYLSGDLYQNHVVTPAMIIVPRRQRGKASYKNVKEGKKEREMECEYGGHDVKEAAPSRSQPQVHGPPPVRRNKAPPKPVDEDLYKISPDLLYATTKKKGASGLFSCCLRPACE